MAGNKMGEQTKDKILAAAQQEFLEKGFEKAKMEDIAKRAGVTKVMLYYHFNAKQNILNEIFKSVLGEIKAAFRANMERIDLGRHENLLGHLRMMMDLYQQRQSIIRLVVSEYISNQNQDDKTLAVFNDLFGLILELAGDNPQLKKDEFLIRLFFFNALPMIMYPCLTDKFCADFGIAPEKCLDVFVDMFAKNFSRNIAESMWRLER